LVGVAALFALAERNLFVLFLHLILSLRTLNTSSVSHFKTCFWFFLFLQLQKFSECPQTPDWLN